MGQKHDVRDLEQALAYIGGVEGWLFPLDAVFMFDMAVLALRQRLAPTIVEVGSYHGRSTIVLGAAACKSGVPAHVYAVDPHEGDLSRKKTVPSWPSFVKNVGQAGLLAPDGPVVPIHKKSADVEWNRPISFLFIDGLHDEASIRADLAKFEPHVVVGGYVAFHDYWNPDFPDVRRVVDELVAAGRLAWLTPQYSPTKENCLYVTRKLRN